MTGMGMMGDFTINGRRFDHSRVDFAVPLGATETWILDQYDADAAPDAYPRRAVPHPVAGRPAARAA